jgi:translation initiation factor 1A
MPGKKKKKRGKKKPREAVKRDLVFKTFQEDYAVITKKLGDRRMLVKTSDMTADIMAVIPGRFRKRCWFDIGDLCLISRREFQDAKVDIVHKYTVDERRALCQCGEIPQMFANAGVDISAPADDLENGENAFEFSFDEI